MKYKLFFLVACLAVIAASQSTVHALEVAEGEGGPGTSPLGPVLPIITDPDDHLDLCFKEYQRRLRVCAYNFYGYLKFCPDTKWTQFGIQTDEFLACRAKYAAARRLCIQDAKDYRAACLAQQP